MLKLWRKWIAFPVGWLAIMLLALAAIAFLARGGLQEAPAMERFHGRYVATSDGTAVRVEVRERIRAHLNNERGILRILPTKYGEHDIGLRDVKVTYGDGNSVPVRETTLRDGALELRIGDPAKRLRGVYNYEI
ncbi:MAG: hypothetical protein Q4G46_12940, partial [Propionibacteriaceae bacterium]|nr:hypothetical protein [Propionibacteriaceae bacterium]